MNDDCGLIERWKQTGPNELLGALNNRSIGTCSVSLKEGSAPLAERFWLGVNIRVPGLEPLHSMSARAGWLDGLHA